MEDGRRGPQSLWPERRFVRSGHWNDDRDHTGGEVSATFLNTPDKMTLSGSWVCP